MFHRFFYLILLNFWVFFYMGFGINYTISQSKRLTQYLMNQHDRDSPPEDRVTLTLDIDLVNIVSVNEVKQRMTVQVFMYEEWFDSTLIWNPNEFGGIQQTWLPIDQIWISDVTVLNTMEYMNIMESVRTPVEVLFTGKVIRSYPALYSVACNINVEKFPLDSQTCHLDIASWGYAKDKVVIQFANRSTLEHYSRNDEWALKAVRLEELIYEFDGLIHSEAKFHIEISRKPLHYVISLVFPCYIICALGIAGLFARFSTRPERQERFSLGVTALVSVAVYGTVVAEKIPHTSRKVPILLLFFLHNLVVLSLATMCAGGILFINWKGCKENDKMPPKWLTKILFCCKKVENIETKIEKAKLHDPIKLTFEAWSIIANRLDTFLFLIFFLSITIPTYEVIRRCAEKLAENDSTGIYMIRGGTS